MIRKLAILGILLLGVASSAWAARRVTVQQLDLLLDEYKGQSDGKVASQLLELTLTERATSSRLTQWEKKFPGRHCHEVLVALVDASSFLELPESEKLPTPNPSPEEARAILEKTIAYVNETGTRLPNFLATRKTEYYEDNPPTQSSHVDNGMSNVIGRRGAYSVPSVSQSSTSNLPIHIVNHATESVSYRDGYEIRGTKRLDPSQMIQPGMGLTTVGEFGPILNVVFPDAIRNKMYWGYWEQGVNGVEAVFRYKVLAADSHYMVKMPKGTQMESIVPAYHGEIAIDPTTGAIMRISVIADLVPPYELVNEAIMVDYGSVPLGGSSYICPVKGVAMAVMPMGDPTSDAVAIQTQLNDVAFTDYHLFRSESRILPATETGSDAPPPAAPPQ
jgi:hypothetical protein